MYSSLNQKTEKICKAHKLTGANIALFNSREILWSYNYGYANKENRIKSDNRSLYMIGSNTKMMTAMCIWKLIEEGCLSLDDDIRKFIPEFEVKSTFSYDKITVGQLLMHRSGLPCDLYNLFFGKYRDFEDVVGALKETYLIAQPGKMFAYSNIGYTVLGVIIQRITGMAYMEFVRETIAKPLGISVHFPVTPEQGASPENISLCYSKKGKAMEDLSPNMLPAGSCTYISMEDFVKFGQVFLKKDGTVLKKETLEKMETLQCPEEIDRILFNGGYGLLHNCHALGQNAQKTFGHGGDTICHHSVFFYLPERNLGVAVFTNSEHAAAAAAKMAMEAVVSYLEEAGIEVKKHTFTYDYTPADPTPYAGKYATPLGVLDIRKNKKGGLSTKLSGVTVDLKHCADGYWQLFPKSFFLRLLPAGKYIKRNRLKFADYLGLPVLIIEQKNSYQRVAQIIGCPLVEGQIPETFRDACGEYEAINEDLKDQKFHCTLAVEQDVLLAKVTVEGETASFCLRPENDHLAFLQGFGRNTGNDVVLTQENGKTQVITCGIVFEKVTPSNKK